MQVCFITVTVVENIWFSRLSIKTLVLYIMQRILYQIQAYIGRLVLLLTKEFGQIIYVVLKTDSLFIIFTFLEMYVLENMEMLKMTTIFKCFMFGKYSSCVGKARGCCMHVFLVMSCISPI